jgi:PadR family transcriptional regulator, regulatory protein PadR
LRFGRGAETRGEPFRDEGVETGEHYFDFKETSSGVLQVEEGSLYPALQRMLLKDWISGDWGKTEENRRARYYSLTAEGRKQLARELDRYARVSQAIAAILQPV